jgi:peptide/nickel transport system substrate-binding protein
MRYRPLFASRLAILLLATTPSLAQSKLRFCIASDPKTFNPLLVEDDSTEAVEYLTGGVLIRINRMTQSAEPELATSWK